MEQGVDSVRFHSTAWNQQKRKRAPIHEKIGIIIAEVGSCQGYCSIRCAALGWRSRAVSPCRAEIERFGLARGRETVIQQLR